MWNAVGVERGNSFWTDPVGDLISCTFKSRPWTDRIVAIAHNAKVFDLLFVLNRLVRIKLLPELLIINGQKITCLKVQNVTWLDSLNYLAIPLRKLPEALGLTAQKSWYPQLFNTTANIYISLARCLVPRHRSDEQVRMERVSVVVRDRREEGRVRQPVSARKLLPGRCDGAARSVPQVPETLSADRECRSVSREHEDRIGL